MRATWNLPEQALSSLPLFRIEEVLVEYQGPQVVSLARRDLDASEPEPLYLGIASDDEGNLVRWILAPITHTEFEAMIDGAVTLRELVCKPQGYVLDVDVEYDWMPRRAWQCDISQLDDEHLPARGALLPTASRRELAAERGDPRSVSRASC